MDVATQLRSKALLQIKNRVAATLVASRLDEQAALQLSCVCALRDVHEALGFIFSRQVARQAETSKTVLAITNEEWKHVFGADAPSLRESCASLVFGDEFAQNRELVKVALRCTLGESAQSKNWSRATSQALVFLGLHMECTGSKLDAVLGGVVHADRRRVEELQARYDDEGTDVLVLSRLLISVCGSICV